MIADYYFIRKQHLNTKDLYQHKGEYTFTNGIHYNAIVALLLGIILNVPGFLTTIKVLPVDSMPSWLTGLYSYAWFVGFFVSGISYILLTKRKTREEINLTTVQLES
jgi:NCS1 family nucleobase:cation symporter-1